MKSQHLAVLVAYTLGVLCASPGCGNSSAANSPTGNGSGGGTTGGTTPPIYNVISHPGACVWSLVGYQADTLQGMSCNGYHFTVNEAPKGKEAFLGTPAIVYYPDANCQGQPYVQQPVPGQAGIDVDTVINGGVWYYAPNAMSPTDPASYVYLPAGETQDNVAIASYMTVGATYTCTELAIPSLTVYALQQNDESITGIASAPVSGPVAISHL